MIYRQTDTSDLKKSRGTKNSMLLSLLHQKYIAYHLFTTRSTFDQSGTIHEIDINSLYVLD